MKTMVAAKWIVVSALTLCCVCSGWACTIWSSAGTSVDGQGTLISKNRDYVPQAQVIRVVKPKSGHPYVALFGRNATTNDEYIAAATNQFGLTLVTATASSIPSAKRKAMPRQKDMLSKLLTSSKTVEEALSHKNWLYGPRFLMMSDRKETALIEIGPEKKIHVDRTSSGTLYHTNYYVSKELASANVSIGSSSKTRYLRIAELLKKARYPLDVTQFRTFSRDHIAGPDNSLFRTGSIEKTLASWIVRTPHTGSPVIYATLWNPNEPEKSYKMQLDDVLSGKTPIN